MAKGSPNGPEKLLNFQMKVLDPVAKDYKPVYIAPDATNVVQGDVLLSDSITSSDNAAVGITAATPLAVKSANDNANTKLSKTQSTAQTVISPTTFNGKVTGSGGFEGNLVGNVTGNATSADKLKTPREIKITNGSKSAAANFDGQAGINLNLTQIDATTVSGVLPISTIPQGALDRLIKVANQAARFALTTNEVQQGDSVLQLDTGVMYVIIDETQLSSAAGYQEYKASTALEAQHAIQADNALTANVASKLGTKNVGNGVQPIFLSGGTATASSSTVGGVLKPIFMNSGVLTASAATSGAINIPLYMSNGTLTPCSFQVNKDVPSNAVFTDTTYNVMSGATASAAGTNGLVPAPAAGNQAKFLRGDGTWQIAGEVTGVKGNAESAYRIGQVNITAANLGITVINNTLDADKRVAFATDATNAASATNATRATTADSATTATTATTAGSATTATTASKLNNTIALSGAVTAAATSLNTTAAITISTTLTDGSVTLGKLGTDVGTIAIQDSEPTDSHVKLWIKI